MNFKSIWIILFLKSCYTPQIKVYSKMKAHVGEGKIKWFTCIKILSFLVCLLLLSEINKIRQNRFLAVVVISVVLLLLCHLRHIPPYNHKSWAFWGFTQFYQTSHFPLNFSTRFSHVHTRTTPHFFLNFMFLSFPPRIFSMFFFCISSFIYNWCLAYI